MYLGLMKNKMLILFAVLCAVSSAFATTLSGQDVYYVDYNFSGNAFSKNVTSVMVHTGILRGEKSGCGISTSPYWDSVQDVEMKQVGDHFFAQARLTVGLGECQPSIDGPIVQYWVTFEDGSTLKTDVAYIPITSQVYGGQNQGPEAQVKAAEGQKTDANTTTATLIDEGFAD